MTNSQPVVNSHKRERAIFLRRIVVLKCVFVLALTVLLARHFYLQILVSGEFITRSEQNRIHLQAIPPHRGRIIDYNGLLLAGNKNVQSVFFFPSTARNNKADEMAVFKQIAQILQLDKEREKELIQQLKLRGEKHSILIKNNISREEHAALLVRRHLLPGLVIEKSSNRYYPYADAFSHVVGYLGAINKKELEQPDFDAKNYRATQLIGKTGAEKQYEALLHGQIGWQKVEVEASGRIHRILSKKTARHGAQLQLGIDARLQLLAHSLMQGKRGAIVAIEPSSGRLMVLLSVPDYDPNLMVNGIDSRTYKTLIGHRDRPFFNRFARGLYPPASTIKPMYALVALQNGLVNPADVIVDKGYYQMDDDPLLYRNWLRTGHGKVNLSRAIRVSNDTYFFGLSDRLGYDFLAQTLRQFGFGSKVAFDVFSESASFIPNEEWKFLRHNTSWFEGDNLNMGIGQGYLLSTPLQLATATAVLANRGNWVHPRLLMGINNKVVDKWHDALSFPVVEAERRHWDFVIRTMVNVVSHPEGTAYRAGLHIPYKIAGKTGTSQVYSLSRSEVDEQLEEVDEYKRDHGLFIAFAPVEEPKIAVAVVVENGGSGGAVAAPIGIELIDSYLRKSNSRLSNLEAK